jgi:hypothetical protein
MRKLIAFVALGIVVAAPAIAQEAQNSEQHRRSTVPPGGIYYYERNNNLNRDYQLGGERWKTNKTKHVRHHGSAKLKRNTHAPS